MNIDKELVKIFNDNFPYSVTGNLPQYEKDVKQLIHNVYASVKPESFYVPEFTDSEHMLNHACKKGFNQALDQFDQNIERILGGRE